MAEADIRPILSISPVIPVVNVAREEDAVPMAQALLAGGVGVIEVTLRTAAALNAIETIRREVPQMCVGAGTVWTDVAADAVIDAGAQFVVSPGRSDDAYEVCLKRGIPMLPGAQTPSEVAVWLARKLPAVKIFPAAVAGGVAALKSLSAVFPGLKFCPTGGISADTAADYLALPSVPCVGGSWLVDRTAAAAGDWDVITATASLAVKLADSADSAGPSPAPAGDLAQKSSDSLPPWDS